MADRPTERRTMLGNIRRLSIAIARRRRVQFLGVFFLSVLSAMAEMATLGAVFPFLSMFTSAGGGNCWGISILCDLTPTEISVGFCIIVLSGAAIRIIMAWASTQFAYGLGADLARDIFDRALRQPYSFHVNQNSNFIISAVNKTNHLVSAVLLPLIQASVSTVILAAIISALLIINTSATITVGLFVCFFYAFVTVYTSRNLSLNSAVVAESEVTRLKILRESLSSVRDMIIDGSQSYYVSKFSAVSLKQKEAQAANYHIRVIPRYVIEAAGMVLLVAIAWWSYSHEGSDATLPTLGAFALAAQRMLPQLQSVYYGLSSLTANQAVLDDVLKLLSLDVEDTGSEASPQPPRLQQAVSIDLVDLCFSYKAGRSVLRNVSLSIPPGTKVGFIGKTGSGKSTLIDLVLGLLEPEAGLILLDGIPMTKANARSWQMQIAHVPQAVYLADASIAENIAFGIDPSRIDMSRVHAAAALAQLSEFVDELPGRFETMVGERGVQLSGGQRQRIGLARAFYKRANVLVLDEATSALDDQTEAAVMSAALGAATDMTVLIVAHRLTTLRTCDFVVELDKGRVKRVGSYAEVTGNADEG